MIPVDLCFFKKLHVDSVSHLDAGRFAQTLPGHSMTKIYVGNIAWRSNGFCFLAETDFTLTYFLLWQQILSYVSLAKAYMHKQIFKFGTFSHQQVLHVIHINIYDWKIIYKIGDIILIFGNYFLLHTTMGEME